MLENRSTLTAFYDGWEAYQSALLKALEPLTPEQLALSAAPTLRPLWELVAHIIGARAGWLYELLGEGGETMAELSQWDIPDAPLRTLPELVYGLQTTWDCLHSCVNRWTPEDMAQLFSLPGRDENWQRSRQWVIWHLIEHDLHHGGEFSLTLGMYGITAPDI